MTPAHGTALPPRGQDAEHAPEEIAMIVSALGGATVAVELNHVLRIDPPQGDAEGSGLRSVDLAAYWGVPLAPAVARRALVVPTDDAPMRLLLGESLRVVSYPATALLAVPAFLRTWASRAMVRKLVAAGEEIGYVLDVARLPELTEQTHA